MQKEEELARLQEENNKLKEFLNSSYVKSLEDKSKVRSVNLHIYVLKAVKFFGPKPVLCPSRVEAFLCSEKRGRAAEEKISTGRERLPQCESAAAGRRGEAHVP